MSIKKVCSYLLIGGLLFSSLNFDDFPFFSFDFSVYNFIVIIVLILSFGSFVKHISMFSLVLFIFLIFSLLFSLSLNVGGYVNNSVLQHFRGFFLLFYFLSFYKDDPEIIEDSFVLLKNLSVIAGFLQILSLLFFFDPKFGLSYDTYISFDKQFNTVLGVPIFRICPFVGDPNYFATYILIGLLIDLKRIYNREKKKSKVFFLFSCLIFLWTFSRGAFLAFGFSFLVLFTSNNYKRPIKFLLKASFVLFLFIIVVSFLGESRGASSSSSTNERLVLLDLAVEKVGEQFFFGHSPGNHYLDFNRMKMGPHNTYLEILLIYGFFFCFAFFMLLCYIFYNSFMTNNSYLLAHFFLFVIMILFLQYLIFNVFWIWLGFLILLAQNNNYIIQKKEELHENIICN
ncbi:MAG: O-antigen ligase family protein [Spirochaetales bacterium]|nr:O-antigen ligase family protein [Spirochaetales bacterium]